MSRQVVARASEVVPGTVEARDREGPRDRHLQHRRDISRSPTAARTPAARCAAAASFRWCMSDGPGHYRLARHQEFLRCPWHGWEFDIRTGQSWCDPHSTRARQFAVTVESGEKLVKGPYVAETFPSRSRRITSSSSWPGNAKWVGRRDAHPCRAILRPRDRRVGEDLVLLRAVAFTSKALLL